MSPDKCTVFLARCPSYDTPVLKQTIDCLLGQASSGLRLAGKRVLLKPNLLSARNRLACTEARVIIAAAEHFMECGALVSVGDSPAFGSARSVLAAIGALAPLQRLGVPVREFHPARKLRLAGGVQVGLAEAALESDLLINLPKVKAHAQTRLTLAIKNCFGCVSGFQKPWWHMLYGGPNGPFASLVVALLPALPPMLTLADGVLAMHRTGPMNGEPFSLGLLAASANAVAVDSVLLAILGVEAKQCPISLAAAQAGLAGANLEHISVHGEPMSSFSSQGFEVPALLEPIRFHPWRFMKNSSKRLWLRTLKR